VLPETESDRRCCCERDKQSHDRSSRSSTAGAGCFRGLPVGATVVEVGVWKGDFSASCSTRSGGVLHSWIPAVRPITAEVVAGRGRRDRQADMDAIAASVCTRFAEQIEWGQGRTYRFSVEVRSTLPARQRRRVYIDGNQHL